MTYTKDLPSKFFLNDKNIASSLAYDDIQINAIPSLDLVSSLYQKLSVEDGRLNDFIVSVQTSAYGISADVNARVRELSNVLSAYSDKLCAAVSSQVDASRAADKEELSLALSTYVDASVAALSSSLSTDIDNLSAALSVEIDSLSDALSGDIDSLSAALSNDIDSLSASLSNEVNAKFVHLSGDTINGSLSVTQQVTVGKDAAFGSNVHITNNLTQGKGSYVDSTIDRGIALGISAVANKNDAFVWNGDDSASESYTAQGDKAGTFNVNTRDGANGFYVRDKSLSTIIHDDVKLSSDSLVARTDSISTALSAAVDTDRTEDKIELSAVLSSYSDSLSAALSTAVDIRRAEDYLSATDAAALSVTSLSSSLSAFIDNAKYSVIDKVGFSYDDKNHIITLSVADQLDNKKTFTIDSSDFIKNRIVDHVDVVTKEQDPKLSETVLRIWWTPDEETTAGIYTDIPISQLARVYTSGEGISVGSDLKISVIDYNSRVAELMQATDNIKTLSTVTVPGVDARLVKVETYVDELSAKNGIVDQLSDDLHSLSDGISADVKDLSDNVVAGIRADVDKVSAHASSLQSYADQLSGFGDKVGDVPFLSGSIDDVREDIRGLLVYAGEINFDKYAPDWVNDSGDKCLSSLFKYKVNLGTRDAIKCGSVYKVVLQEHATLNPKFVMSEPLYAADQYFDTDDGVRIAHNCYLEVQSEDTSVSEIPVEQIGADNVKVIAGEWYVPYMLSVIDNVDDIWRDGKNCLTSAVDVSVITEHSEPAVQTIAGHAISGSNDIGGSNHFLDGSNVFDGYNKVEQLSVHGLSADGLSAFMLSADKLSAGLEADFLSSSFTVKKDEVKSEYKTVVNNKLSVTGAAEFSSTVSVDSSLTVANVLTATNSTKTLDVENISAGTLSADWTKVKHTTGYSLFDLSTALSNKIFIDNRVDRTVNGTSDLSIVKIAKDDYDDGVALGTVPFSGNIMYVVDSDYIDAYGEQLCNLTMPEDSVATVATNKHYVDSICADISDTVVLSVGNLQSQVTSNDNDITFLSGQHDWLSAQLSTQHDSLSTSLSTEISTIRHAFADLYTKISGINDSSVLSDVISAVVAIKNTLTVLTAY